MSMILVIKCDDCGELAAPSWPNATHRAIRAEQRKHGWKRQKPGVDTCPDCTKKRRERERAENPRGYV